MEEKMTLDQLIAQIRVERAQAAGYVQKLDSALSALTKTTAVLSPTASTGTGRVWTPEQKMKLSIALKKRWAAKKKAG
jgi:Spy/CpxP family protein refolding chaperone